MNLYPNKEFSVISAELKKMYSSKIKLTKKDYETIVKASDNGEWSDVYNLDYYKHHGGEYCALLQLLPYHRVRLLFYINPDHSYSVLNKDRIFNNDYLKIATISPDKKIKPTSSHLHDVELREIKKYINKLENEIAS